MSNQVTIRAHEANDRAMLAAYGLAPDTPEPEIVAHLFKLYADKTNEVKGNPKWKREIYKHEQQKE
jgi:hypothetical protein